MENLIPVLLSLKIAFISTIVVLVLGVVLARVMTRFDFAGKDLVESIVTLPLVLPPTVIGFGLLMAFGHSGPLGKIINLIFHQSVIFTWFAAAIAATVVAFPLMYRSACTAMENVDGKLEMAARTLGASEIKIFFTITLPLARYGILSGLVMAFARALGEFGATLMVAGNIPGQTETMPLAVYFALESGNTALAVYYVLIMTVLAFIAVTLVNRWSKKKSYSSAAKVQGRRKSNAARQFAEKIT